MSMGITANYEKNYNASIDSLKKAVKALEMLSYDIGNITVCYLVIGKAYEGQGKMNNAILYYKKVDSIIEKTLYVTPYTREAYKPLIDYYKGKGDLKNQLKYRNHLSRADSLIGNRYKYFGKNIFKKYDASELTYQKNEVIAKNEKDKKKLIRWIIISLLIILLLVSIFTYYYSRQRIRFKALINEKNTEKKQTLDKSLADLGIAKEVLNDIKEKLKEFIDDERFLDNNVSLSNWAEAMETNTKYLSQYINAAEKKNFPVYLADLRINYAIEKLKNDRIFRKYSVKGIAEAVGFNNAQSFSQAFHRKTGIKPSYFIKELKKELLRQQKRQDSS